MSKLTDEQQYRDWFTGEQGKPYDGAWDFAMAAWKAGRALLAKEVESAASAVPLTWIDSGLYADLVDMLPNSTVMTRDVTFRKTQFSNYDKPLFRASPTPPTESAVPEGWKLMPIKLAHEMLNELYRRANMNMHFSFEDIYETMLETSPTPPAKSVITTDDVLDFFGGRKGFSGWFDGIDDQVQEEIKSELAELLGSAKSVPGWQPIESAPKDGTYILVSDDNGTWIAQYKAVFTSGYRPSDPWQSMMLNHNHIPKEHRWDKPTKWMPLPAATIEAKSEPSK